MADGKGNLRIYRAAARGGHRFTFKNEEHGRPANVFVPEKIICNTLAPT